MVPWDQVAEHAHLRSDLLLSAPRAAESRRAGGSGAGLNDKELEEIFVRTYGPIKNRGMDALAQRRRTAERPSLDDVAYVHKDDVLVVDGYNMIFAWDELKAVASEHLDAARAALVRLLCNYQGMRGCRVIVVFDAYRVKGNAGASEKEAGVEIVYTKEGETADAYIERLSYELGRTHHVKVATGDALEQIVVLGHGAQRLSARELKWEIEQVNERIEDYLKRQQ